jgi:Activator of Hsp90 ATPase homolog 1-like protein
MKKNTTMEVEDFTLVLSTDKSPKEVFDAVTNVRGWWSAKLKGNSKKQGDEFEFQYEDIHYSTQKLVEVIPNKKVVWLVTDSRLTFLKKDQGEWTNTKVCFEISEKGKMTEVRFTHLGLVPEIECFEACSEGWTHYLKNSLLKLINTGKGKPD